MKKHYDVIIIGAGSIGIPTAMALTKLKIKTLVIDKNSSIGQGDNKKAIGGIRATHSDPAKILIGKRSIEIFSNWENTYGDTIEWIQGGYLFPIYQNKEKETLTDLLKIQKKFGLKINFIEKEEVKKIIPIIYSKNLLGGIFSPNDGTASPLLSINAFAKQALINGTTLKLNEKINKIIIKKNKIQGVASNKNIYTAPILIDAAGSFSPQICNLVNEKINIAPDLHEAAITEPVEKLFKCLVVDLRSEINSKNFYLYQNIHGQIIFCVTPDPPIFGNSPDETSTFLPLACNRIIKLIPSLSKIRVRRTWRGFYPMTPDGLPIIGWNKNIKGLFHSTGLCGQGFMLGPGLGEYISRTISNTNNNSDDIIKKIFSPKRKFSINQEKLK